MKIDKVKLQDRRAQLAALYEQHIFDASACKGAMEDCDYWLLILDKEESEATSQKIKQKDRQSK